ncbi:MAG: agmatinase, partial [Pseudomonadota bacterium]
MPSQPVSGNDLARFAGLQTFMRLPACETATDLDVAFL